VFRRGISAAAAECQMGKNGKITGALHRLLPTGDG
jgi:hypothetical protein